MTRYSRQRRRGITTQTMQRQVPVARDTGDPFILRAPQASTLLLRRRRNAAMDLNQDSEAEISIIEQMGWEGSFSIDVSAADESSVTDTSTTVSSLSSIGHLTDRPLEPASSARTYRYAGHRSQRRRRRAGAMYQAKPSISAHHQDLEQKIPAGQPSFSQSEAAGDMYTTEIPRQSTIIIQSPPLSQRIVAAQQLLEQTLQTQRMLRLSSDDSSNSMMSVESSVFCSPYSPLPWVHTADGLYSAYTQSPVSAHTDSSWLVMSA